MGFFVCGMMCRFGIAMKKSYILLLFITCILKAQPDSIWSNNYGDDIETESGNYVRQTTDGGYVITGSWANWTGPYTALIKTDSDGNELWIQIFTDEDSSDSEGKMVQQTSDGGYVIVGNLKENGTDDFDIWLIKTDESGELQWG